MRFQDDPEGVEDAARPGRPSTSKTVKKNFFTDYLCYHNTVTKYFIHREVII